MLVVTIGSLAKATCLLEKPFNPYDGMQYPHGMMEMMKVDWDNTIGQIKINMQNLGQSQAVVGISVNGQGVTFEGIFITEYWISHHKSIDHTAIRNEIILTRKFSQVTEFSDIKVTTDFGACGKYPTKDSLQC